MAVLADFNKVAADFADIADFATIYISEAHASDEWDFKGNRYKIKQHSSLQERIMAASILLEDEQLKPPGTFLIDDLKNDAENVYGAYPERLYIVLDGVIVFAGEPGPHGYKVSGVKEWLEEYRGKSQ